MDILYIIGRGTSHCNNFELRMSLRSLEKYGKGVGRIFIAGYCPEWLSDNVIKVPFIQPYEMPRNLAEKHINMISTVLYAVSNTDIDNEFLLSMDDHIFIRPTDFDNYPFYTKKFGEFDHLPQKDTIQCNSEYREFLGDTRIMCEKYNIDKYYLCPHRNMHMSRKIIDECKPILDEVIEKQIPCETFAFMLNWRHTKYGFDITSTVDVKIQNSSQWWKADPEQTEIISTSDFRIGDKLYNLILDKFPEMSKYEITDLETYEEIRKRFFNYEFILKKK